MPFFMYTILMEKNIILQAVLGSTAYGLNTPTSDIDMMGIFIAPTVGVAGLNWHSSKETWTNASPDGDDLTLHEIGKFCKLCLKTNPTLIELLYADDYVVQSEIGVELLDLRDSFLSEHSVRTAYTGYSISNLKYVKTCISENKPVELYAKKAKHTLRISRQGQMLLQKGTLSLKVEDPQEYKDLTNLDGQAIISKLDKEIDELRQCDSVLNSEPDRESVEEFLAKVRINNILENEK